MSISTHVLDTASGKPASGVRVRLLSQNQELGSGTTNQEGRIPALVAPGISLERGIYRLEFETGDYFPQSFYPMVIIFFNVHDELAHYHIPLLISPFGYTTYRGT